MNYDREIAVINALIARYERKGRDSTCLTVKEHCAWIIAELRDIRKEYERINEKG
jgi:hypothetical protein